MEYRYTKIRGDFGRQCAFAETMPDFLDSINPDIKEQKNYCLRNPVHREVQASLPFSQHTVSTKRVVTKSTSINHLEGGWPHDVDYLDEEATSRYRRRVERSDEYVEAILATSKPMEHIIKQNNILDIYEIFYKGIPEFESFPSPSYQLLNKVKDPWNKRCKRPVACIEWICESSSKLIISYCNKNYPQRALSNNSILDCYVWDMNQLLQPIYKFLPPTACWQITSSPMSPDSVIGGLEDGRVCIFDMRVGHNPVHVSDIHVSNKCPITSLIFTDYRTGNQFSCGSSDGLCLWYDIRHISTPIDSLYMSVLVPPKEKPNMSNAEPVSVLQFHKALPTTFLCGTDTGLIINVNRKGKSHKEIMSAVFEAHLGPVKALQRNPFIIKMIISCGDWSTHIWNEQTQTSPVITGTSQRYQIEDVAWSPGRVSGYMSVDSNGKFRYWDILRNQRDPVLTIPLSKQPLLKIKPQLNGRIIVMGDKEGSIFFLSLSESLADSDATDKEKMVQMFERETHREHILETRIKEIRVKAMPAKVTTTIEETVDSKGEFDAVENEYRKIVIEEIKKNF